MKLKFYLLFTIIQITNNVSAQVYYYPFNPDTCTKCTSPFSSAIVNSINDYWVTHKSANSQNGIMNDELYHIQNNIIKKYDASTFKLNDYFGIAQVLKNPVTNQILVEVPQTGFYEFNGNTWSLFNKPTNNSSDSLYIFNKSAFDKSGGLWSWFYSVKLNRWEIIELKNHKFEKRYDTSLLHINPLHYKLTNANHAVWLLPYDSNKVWFVYNNANSTSTYSHIDFRLYNGSTWQQFNYIDSVFSLPTNIHQSLMHGWHLDKNGDIRFMYIKNGNNNATYYFCKFDGKKFSYDSIPFTSFGFTSYPLAKTFYYDDNLNKIWFMYINSNPGGGIWVSNFDFSTRTFTNYNPGLPLFPTNTSYFLGKDCNYNVLLNSNIGNPPFYWFYPNAAKPENDPCITIGTGDANKNLFNNHFVVNSNPCTVCEIEIENINATTLYIFDVWGRRVNKPFIKTLKGYSVDLQSEPSGIYIVRSFQTGNAIKLLKE